MTCDEVEMALVTRHQWNPRTHAMVPNVSWALLNHEADLLVVNSNRWATEVEIKVSWADFKREFQKDGSKAIKHKLMLIGGGFGGQKLKHYYVAAPADLAQRINASGLLPEYAGLLSVPDQGRVETLKTAPQLHGCRQLKEAEYCTVFRLGMLRYWDMRKREAA